VPAQTLHSQVIYIQGDVFCPEKLKGKFRHVMLVITGRKWPLIVEFASVFHTVTNGFGHRNKPLVLDK
jgi:hypothetical protein